MMNYGVANTDNDLLQILDLQAINLPSNISEEEAQSQGFVTVHHDFDLLKKMNAPYPHIVARDSDRIIGYTLVMLRSFEKEIPVLIPMFQQIDAIIFDNKKLGNAKYFVMGQVCIDKAYRGRSIFAGLYNEMKKRMSPFFEYIITEVDKRNIRSLRAHEKVGFKNVLEYSTEKDWVILLLSTKR